MEFDWDFAWKIGSFLFGLILSLVLYSMRKTFTKVEDFQELDKRVQSVEQTYTPKDNHDELEKRFVKVETSLKSLEKIPDLVSNVSQQASQVEQTCKHLEQTIQRVEHPLKLIVEAAMKSKD